MSGRTESKKARMTFDEARRQVLEAIDYTTSALNDKRFAEFVRGSAGDLAFADLDLDSLASMEICRLLEEQTGVEVDLGDLVAQGSVNSLALMIAARSGE